VQSYSKLSKVGHVFVIDIVIGVEGTLDLMAGSIGSSIAKALDVLCAAASWCAGGKWLSLPRLDDQR
jgi:hypothetical protein